MHTTGHSHLLTKDIYSTWAADEWVFAGRQCEITQLLFFNAKHCQHKHALLPHRTALPVCDNSFALSYHSSLLIFSICFCPPSSPFPCFKHFPACGLFNNFFCTPLYLLHREQGIQQANPAPQKEAVCLICPERAFKPVLIFPVCSGVWHLHRTVKPLWTPLLRL